MFRKEQCTNKQKKNSLLPNGYFTVQSNAMSMTENAINFDVKVNVYGGGSTGQAKL
jgi:ribosomal protein S9